MSKTKIPIIPQPFSALRRSPRLQQPLNKQLTSPDFGTPQPSSGLRRSSRLQQPLNKQPTSPDFRTPQPSSSYCSSRAPKRSRVKTHNQFKENGMQACFSELGLRRSPRFSKRGQESLRLYGSPALRVGKKSGSNLNDKYVVDNFENVAVSKSRKVVRDGQFKENGIQTSFSKLGLQRSPRFSKRGQESLRLDGSPAFSVGKKSGSNLNDKYVVDNFENVTISKSRKVVRDGLKRSPRLSNTRNTDRNVTAKSKLLQEKETLAYGENEEMGNGECQNLVERKVKKRSSVVGFEEVVRDRDGEDVGEEEERGEIVRNNGTGRKRRRGREGDKDGASDWTHEQEMALQRAYFTMKPTPQFWKKVAKMVPGKSAPDCFNKIHSTTLTPPQSRPRSRAKITKQSPICYGISASEMPMSSEPKTKRSTRCRQKTHRAQKTVRHLLQKHYNMEKDCQTDLFSILEPATASFLQNVQESSIPSTPIHALKKPVFLRKCSGSSAGPKKPLSRLSNLCPESLVSPPVLKQVKNKELHEKYIDQLHNRDAKRKAASSRKRKIPPVDKVKMECHQNLDVVKAAKNALVSDASNVINLFRSQRASSTSDSSECDDENYFDEDEI